MSVGSAGKKTGPVLRIHGFLAESYANGPGKRAVIWVQGCPLACPRCWNPDLQDPGGGRTVGIESLMGRLTALPDIEGLTVSGGEPTEQAAPLAMLLEQVRRQTGLSVLLFSGRTMARIKSMAGGSRLLAATDVLIDGPYDHRLANADGAWPASTNQNILFLTDRYTIFDFADIPGLEIFIRPDGIIVTTGILA
ncbi:MAG: 4Fe-4S cluster-binding domain-containing protein [Proteobacteria bacterium]|nr:4Fe-4S cluster-binding domain-containing protein [Pseudomonadota bacterium]